MTRNNSDIGLTVQSASPLPPTFPAQLSWLAASRPSSPHLGRRRTPPTRAVNLPLERKFDYWSSPPPSALATRAPSPVATPTEAFPVTPPSSSSPPTRHEPSHTRSPSPAYHLSPPSTASSSSYTCVLSEQAHERIKARRQSLQNNPPALGLNMPVEPGLKRKVVILGSPSVGKTSITQQYVTPPTYNDAYFPTIESTSQKVVKYKGVEYDCEIVDTAGQDEFSLFPPKYAVGVHGYMLVYSIASRQSFDMISTLHEKILDQGGLERVPCVIVGQKVDLANERRVTTAEGEALAKKLGAAFVESSAKDNQNIDRAFDALLSEMQREYNPEPEKKKKGWWPFS